jgi:hypothetical protein
MVQSQPEQIVHETLPQKYPTQKKWLEAWFLGPEFKLQLTCKKRKKKDVISRKMDGTRNQVD